MHTPLITVIDDDLPFLELMHDLLREEGYHAVCCATASDGLVTVGLTHPHLVIVDLWMETRDAGWQFLDHLRHDPRTAAIPVLICSADHASLAIHASQLRACGCGVLTKPFALDDLFAAVRAALPARRTHAVP